MYQPVWVACRFEYTADLCPVHSENADRSPPSPSMQVMTRMSAAADVMFGFLRYPFDGAGGGSCDAGRVRRFTSGVGLLSTVRIASRL